MACQTEELGQTQISVRFTCPEMRPVLFHVRNLLDFMYRSLDNDKFFHSLAT